jgi:hypothetical protein
MTEFVQLVSVDRVLSLMALPPEDRGAYLLGALNCSCRYCREEGGDAM